MAPESLQLSLLAPMIPWLSIPGSYLYEPDVKMTRMCKLINLKKDCVGFEEKQNVSAYYVNIFLISQSSSNGLKE